MRAELAHTYPVPLKKGFDYIDDFKMWPDWYVGMIEILEPQEAKWMEPGDKVHFAYKLLGRRIEGFMELEEWKDGELVKCHTDVPGLPEIHFTYTYVMAGSEAFILRVLMETEEPTTFFGKTIDRMLLPKVIERDLKRSMENLHDIFTAGLFE